MKKFIFLWGLGIFVFVYFSMASVSLVSNSIETNYSGGELIRGKIFLTLTNQPTSSLITSNFPGNRTLIQLLQAQTNLTQGSSYTCNTPDCTDTYTSQGLTNGFLLSEGSKKYAGFIFSGTGVSVNSAKFSVQSNAISSCLPQIKIDVLNDGNDLLTNSNTDGQSCGQRYFGCYNQSNTIEATITSGIEYCEKVSLPASSGFIIGGEIRNGTSDANLTMKLYDYSEGGIAGTCSLPKHTQALQELSCGINYTAPEQRDYFVCVTSSNNGGFKIGWETGGNTCGSAQGFESLSSDFDLFVETTRYSASPNFVVNETTYEQQFNTNLASVIDGYIVDKYNRECQPTSCIVPISFSGANQFVQISESNLEYNTVGVPASVQGLYEITSADALINGNNLSIDISKANFTIPIDSNENKFKLFVDGNNVFEKSITIKKGFVFDVEPKFVAFGQTTNFAIITDKTINSSSWSFGDSTPVQEVSGKNAVHTYTLNNGTIFQITVTARESTGLEAVKTFNVFVGDPRELANKTIKDYKLRLENITTQINSLPSWAVQEIQNLVKLQEINSRLVAAENKYRTATNENDYRSVMIDLLALKMPKSIVAVESGNKLPLTISTSSINSNYIERIDNKDISDNSKLSERILAWMNEKFSSEITFSKIAAIRDFDSEVLFTLFSLETKPVGDFDEEVYLIFGQDIESAGYYKPGYQVRSISGINIDYVTINLESNQIFDFIIKGDISPESLGAYISPSIDYLAIEDAPDKTCKIDNICSDDEDASSCPEDCSRKWIKFSIIGWIILGIAFLVTYIILQEWYKKRYQKHLFPDENDLYNLINFIYTARRSRLNEEQIKSRLKSQGWSSERISFAFKKIEGKRIGMLEIPLFTHSQHKETIAKLSARQGAPVDARFIKRPYFN